MTKPTLDEARENWRVYRTMRLDVDCPQGCDEGWVATVGCGGHLCGWEGHYGLQPVPVASDGP
jgi:hypothetical protein